MITAPAWQWMGEMDTDGPRTQRTLTDREISKFLSLVLRHDPGRIDISPDPQGWVEIALLIRQARRHGRSFDLADPAARGARQ